MNFVMSSCLIAPHFVFRLQQDDLVDLNVLSKSEIFLPIYSDWILRNNKKVLLICSKKNKNDFGSIFSSTHKSNVEWL
jgi:hypothetical protein